MNGNPHEYGCERERERERNRERERGAQRANTGIVWSSLHRDSDLDSDFPGTLINDNSTINVFIIIF